MPSAILYSSTGVNLTSTEIDFANRIVASYSVAMKHGGAKIIKRIDPNTGTQVEYHVDKNIAWVTPGGITYYSPVVMPNPVPYKALFIVGGIERLTSTPFSSVSRILTSDGTILADELFTYDTSSALWQEASTLYALNQGSFYNTNDIGIHRWNGGSSVWQQTLSKVGPNWNNFTNTLNHKMTFVVPEDCIYPYPLSVAPTYTGTDGLSYQWTSEWTIGNNEFYSRVKAWRKKNSDEVISALKTGFSSITTGVTRPELLTGNIPSIWEYYIKIAAKYSNKTYQPTIINISFVDSVLSDTSSGLTVTGVKTTQRTTTIEYTDLNGILQQQIVVGSLTQDIIFHTKTGFSPIPSRKDTYFDWYEEFQHSYDVQFWLDKSPTSKGHLWNGIYQYGKNADSATGLPTNPYAYDGYSPTYPNAYNTLKATAVPMYFQYHNDVKPKYHSTTPITTHDGSVLWNNSLLYGVKEIEITPIGLIADGTGTAAPGETVGIFPFGEDGSQFEIYGTSVYSFDWSTGTLSFKAWKPLLDSNGVEILAKTYSFPAGYKWSSRSINCIVTYKNLVWPDVVELITAENKSMVDGSFSYIDPTTGITEASDPVLYELIKAIKAG